jgi:hypothetical protein
MIYLHSSLPKSLGAPARVESHSRAGVFSWHGFWSLCGHDFLRRMQCRFTNTSAKHAATASKSLCSPVTLKPTFTAPPAGRKKSASWSVAPVRSAGAPAGFARGVRPRAFPERIDPPPAVGWKRKRSVAFNRVLKNKHRAVSQGVRRLGKRSICGHM